MKLPDNLVYSTDPAVQKKLNGKEKSRATAHGKNEPVDGIIRIHRETKGRGGKGVSIITGLVLNEKAIHDLAKQLKQHCGTGGTVKDGTIEIQGDQRDKIKIWLEKHGHTVKIAGG